MLGKQLNILVYQKDISNINLEKIRPPYKSNWYKEYSNLNIDDYIKSLKKN